MSTEKQTEALRLADWCDEHSWGISHPAKEAASELRRQHASETKLDAENLALHRETAELRLQLGQMTHQHKMQCDMRKGLEAQLEAVGADGPSDAEIIKLADRTRTAEGGASGYILPISFARAVLARWGAPRQSAPVLVPLTDAQCKSCIPVVEVKEDGETKHKRMVWMQQRHVIEAIRNAESLHVITSKPKGAQA